MSRDNGQDTITIQELLQRIDAACDGMGDRHPNKVLLRQCRVAICYLAERVPQGEVVTRGGIVLP